MYRHAPTHTEDCNGPGAGIVGRYDAISRSTHEKRVQLLDRELAQVRWHPLCRATEGPRQASPHCEAIVTCAADARSELAGKANMKICADRNGPQGR